MNTKKFYLAPIQAYQYVSKMLPASCRYYPSCSEYASWQFRFNPPHKALAQSTLRILRCNQLFKGGIDYPLVEMNFQKVSNLLMTNSNYGRIKIIYWFVPVKPLSSQGLKTTTQYYVLKDFDAIDTQRTS